METERITRRRLFASLGMAAGAAVVAGSTGVLDASPMRYVRGLAARSGGAALGIVPGLAGVSGPALTGGSPSAAYCSLGDHGGNAAADGPDASLLELYEAGVI